MLKDLLENMAKYLVDDASSVVVSEVEGEQTSVLKLRVAKDDVGKVIGKQGNTAKAIRTIMSAASTKAKRRTVLEILD